MKERPCHLLVTRASGDLSARRVTQFLPHSHNPSAIAPYDSGQCDVRQLLLSTPQLQLVHPAHQGQGGPADQGLEQGSRDSVHCSGPGPVKHYNQHVCAGGDPKAGARRLERRRSSPCIGCPGYCRVTGSITSLLCLHTSPRPGVSLSKFLWGILAERGPAMRSRGLRCILWASAPRGAMLLWH